MKYFFDKLMCLKNDDAVVQGDFNSQFAKQLVIRFEICRDKDFCRKEEDIMAWMNRKFIFIIEN